MRTIYLDHNATTPMRPEVIEAMARCAEQAYANPASQHRSGQHARRLLDEARQRLAAILGADTSGPASDRVLFTSGGTEANNLAILGITRARSPGRPGHLIVSAIEHPSVLDPAQELMEQAWRLDCLSVTPDGVVRQDSLRSLLTQQTALVSVMLANHDTGVLQPVAELARFCREAGVPMHTDAIQVVGKRPIHFRQLGVAALSIAAHKFQGPVGIGALVLHGDLDLKPMFYGGAQQWGLRPGTESLSLVTGMLTALELWQQEQEELARRMTDLRLCFESGLTAGLDGVVVNGVGPERLPQTSSIAFVGLDGQVLLMALDMAGVACSIGAACSSGSSEPSPTLRAMGLPATVVNSSLRFSLGATTTEADIDEAIRRIVQVVRRLRA